MNTPVKIEDRPTLEQLARDILADRWDRMPDGDYTLNSDDTWRDAAQLYLVNLADGFVEPAELTDLIARGIAAEDHSDLSYRAVFLSPHLLENFQEDYGYQIDICDFFASNKEEYRARAAESYAPAIGGVA